MNDAFVGRAAAYYAGKLRAHGPTHRGVDWSSAESQQLRFHKLLRLCDGEGGLEINDYGCGYGALVDHLAADGRPFQYAGYDAAPEMVEAAKGRHAGTPGCSFTSIRSDLARRAYTIASGIFNVKFDVSPDDWWTYVSGELDDIAAVSTKGFAFNLLTAYSDPERRRGDLFYAEPEAVFRHCMTRYSRAVALSHDYPLYEFTVVVRL
jgi:SAM-dependent methyltransferase